MPFSKAQHFSWQDEIVEHVRHILALFKHVFKKSSVFVNFTQKNSNTFDEPHAEETE